MNIYMLFKNDLTQYSNMVGQWCLIYLSKSTFYAIVGFRIANACGVKTLHVGQ